MHLFEVFTCIPAISNGVLILTLILSNKLVIFAYLKNGLFLLKYLYTISTNLTLKILVYQKLMNFLLFVN